MSDETTEKPETTEAAEGETAAEKAAPRTAPPGMLTRPTDYAARPGFRSPPNTKSKAQKAKKKK